MVQLYSYYLRIPDFLHTAGSDRAHHIQPVRFWSMHYLINRQFMKIEQKLNMFAETKE